MRNINWKMVGRRIAYGASLLAVGGTAAYSSYFHIRDVAILGHQRAEIAVGLPFSVDGMMLVATLAIAEDKAQGRKPRRWARFALALGALVSLAANIAATAVHYPDPLSIAAASWSPIALFVVVEVMTKKGKLIPVVPVVTPPVAVAAPAPVAAAPVVPQPVSAAPGMPLIPQAPAPVVPQAPVPATPGPVAQAQQVVRQTSANMPAPVSPAPAGASGALTTGPRAGDRVMKSPLTGRVLMETPPRA